jgi:hypothetical protein
MFQAFLGVVFAHIISATPEDDFIFFHFIYFHPPSDLYRYGSSHNDINYTECAMHLSQHNLQNNIKDKLI